MTFPRDNAKQGLTKCHKLWELLVFFVAFQREMMLEVLAMLEKLRQNSFKSADLGRYEEDSFLFGQMSCTSKETTTTTTFDIIFEDQSKFVLTVDNIEFRIQALVLI